ncbi:Benzyl alcohol O-benzoyltransferase [Dichanthelium oligosanthes]|uniref:Benzyl alcohol O-benzoyltransferase n=1 Tax=Dichanthelium oligosanthes TaxID=888268 RepID=A0A1E5VQE1_9POAL|nr:Benzyl alcohol O-benzoyltransferase [Dichanthelium oligosanthes]
MTTPAFSFAVRRWEPVLVGPAAPTPRETKRLSDMDDQETLHRQVPFLFFYRGGVHAHADDRDPAGVIRRALGGALVPYYPLAGWLREVEARKLVVDFTSEGVMFVAADADVRLAELEAATRLTPPFPCMDQLLFDVDGSNGVLNCPLLLIQVTRLLCGGFVLALRLNHTICDAIGIAQFMSAVAELARGLSAPTVEPAWSRELLEARSPPQAGVPSPGLPPNLAAATTFEVLTAALWRARTAALDFPPEEEVRMVATVNFRGVSELGLPAGYYGNACVAVAVLTTAGALLAGSLGDAVELVRQTKAALTAEYVRSTVDLLVLRGRPGVALANLFLVSDNRHTGFHRVDLGWGEPVYGGPEETMFGVSFFVHVGNGGGEDAVAVLVVLPRQAMNRFASEPVLVGSAAPTPRETKRLSDIDDQDMLRRHVRLMFFYRGGPPADDPVGVIRRALGEALVPYYPFAGRLREVEARKLVVDCTGEGVMFVEADADVRLAELEAAGPGLRPPFPYMDQLLFDVEGSGGVLNCPLLLIQVTRLLCGGFVFALRLNHTICDADGIAQFISAVAELCRGLPAPTVAPVWSRELLEARSPPKPAFRHREYDVVPVRPPPPGEMVMRTFTFRPRDVAAIKMCLPPLLRDTATSFESVTAALWRARTAALELAPDEEIRFVIVANCRSVRELGLPDGYYGNAAVFPAVLTTAGALVAGSLGDAVELVREAKAAVTAEYVRSAADLIVLRGRPAMTMANLFIVSDNRHAGFHRVDFGWGAPVFGGCATAVFGASFLVAVVNGDGEEAVAVPIMLPRPVMDRFASEIQMIMAALPVGPAARALRGRL